MQFGYVGQRDNLVLLWCYGSSSGGKFLVLLLEWSHDWLIVAEVDISLEPRKDGVE